MLAMFLGKRCWQLFLDFLLANVFGTLCWIIVLPFLKSNLGECVVVFFRFLCFGTKFVENVFGIIIWKQNWQAFFGKSIGNCFWDVVFVF